MQPDHILNPRRASLDALHARAVKTVSRVMKSDKEFAQLKAAEIVLARTAPIPREPVQVTNQLGVLAVTPEELAGLLRRHAPALSGALNHSTDAETASADGQSGARHSAST